VTGLPSRIEPGDTFSLEADVRGQGEVSLGGLDIEWSSTDPSIANVDAGQVEALRSGTASIMAMVGDVASSVVVTVAEPAPSSVAVRPASVNMQKGGRITLGARVLDRRDRTLETRVRWRSSDESIATVDQSGNVVAVGPGSATVTAESEAVTGSAQIAVEAATPSAADRTVTDRTVMAPHTPGAPSVTPAQPPSTRPAASVGTDTGSTTSPGSSAPPPSRPSSPRRATPARPPRKRRGPAALIGAVLAVLAVGGGGYWAMTRWGGPAAQASGGDVTGVDGTGGAEPGPGAADSLPTGASQLAGEPSGALQGEDEAQETDTPPTETVAETDEPVTDVAQGAAAPPEEAPTPPPPVSQPPEEEPGPTPAPVPGTVAVDVAQTSIAYAATERASARVFSTAGAPMGSGDYALSWQSSDPAVLAVDGNGTITAVGPGTAWIVASADGARDSVAISVTVDVEIEGSDFTLEEGGSRRLSAAVTGASGAALDVAPTWRSSDATVARVDERTGEVAAVGTGSARITASVSGFESTVTVSVEAAMPGPPTAEVVRSEVEAYVSLVSSGDVDAVNRLWGAGSEDVRRELFELMDENDFSARLDAMGDPSLQGDVVRVSFRVVGEYRNFAGAGRDETVDFQAELRVSGGGWTLASATATSVGG
jgi:uncharacterized protein YjdB